MNTPSAPAPLPQAKECCPTSTRKRIEFKHALIVDVRERNDFDKLSLDVPDLLNIPLSEFEQRFPEIPRDASERVPEHRRVRRPSPCSRTAC